MLTIGAGTLIRAETQGVTKWGAISADAVFGNMFFNTLAGSHTSAMTLQFAITILALRRDIQCTLHKHLDEVLGDRPREHWSFGEHLPRLMSGYLGAFINEVVRVYGVLPFITRSTSRYAQELLINGERVTIPENAFVLLNTSGTHRNPRYWATPEPCQSEHRPWPIHNFNPEQWLKNSKLDSNGRTNAMTFAPPGTAIGFSEGTRQCLGKRFALVELIAILATIFKDNQVDIFVPGFEEISATERQREAYLKVREESLRRMGNLTFKMAYNLAKKVPVRITARASTACADD